MLGLKLIFTLAISLAAFIADAGTLPGWIVSGKPSDSANYYVVCSSEGIDPQIAQEVAETKCISSAAKLGGVTVNLKSKTVQSTTGADASEVAEIVPLVRNVKCEWTEKFLEQLSSGYRMWLQCKVSKSSIVLNRDTYQAPSRQIAIVNYKRAMLTVSMIPKADIIAVGGPSGERVIEVSSNIQQIELHEGDEWVSVRKHNYQEEKKPLTKWNHGDILTQLFKLQREL